MLLPVSLNLARKRCLVVGGGGVALRKVHSLLECEAHVFVVAPHLCDELASLRERIEYSKRAFHGDDCAGNSLIFACTNSREINAKIADAARELGIWCNIADDSTHSDFHGAATIRRGEISIAISTDGGSPALSRHLKNRIESVIGEEYAQLLRLMSERRAALSSSQNVNLPETKTEKSNLANEELKIADAQNEIPEVINKEIEYSKAQNNVESAAQNENSQSARAEKWRAILASDALELLRNGEFESARKCVDAILQS